MRLRTLIFAVSIALVAYPIISFANVPTATVQEPTNYVSLIETLIGQSETATYLDVKLTIDKLIDPKTNIENTRSEIMGMVEDIKKMTPENATEWEKVKILRTYIYEAGEWNDNKPFSYDLDDPLGSSKTSRLLHYYLKTRKGNCVSMPILHAILGQQIGLDMTISTAPLHMFVRYKDAEGNSINIEATSGGHPARDAWYQNNLPMTPKAISNGMFMKDLSKKEAIAAIGHDLSNVLMRDGPYNQAIMVSEKLIELFPNFGPLYLSRGSAFQKLIETEFQSKYPDTKDVPQEKRAELQYLLQQNIASFNIAEKLGWRHPDEYAIELKSTQESRVD